MNYILFDDDAWKNLLPLTFTRPVCEIRCGILTIREKWEKWLGCEVSWLTEEHLAEKFPVKRGPENILINGSVFPEKNLVEKIKSLKSGEALKKDNFVIALHTGNQIPDLPSLIVPTDMADLWKQAVARIEHPWEIFTMNGSAIDTDFQLITDGRKSAALSKTVNVIGRENIFAESGVRAEFVTLNASGGKIYLGKDCELMEGSLVRGPFAIGEQSVLKLGTKIYGPTTLGPFCKAGGEINNSVIFGYSNKAHDGFLGNSVIGEWCNLGADTNNSNLKNNYAEVRLWNYATNSFVKTGLQFCGLVMGDHSKCGINTMFNTGTVVGVSANIFGSEFPRNFIQSFTWGGAHGLTTFALDKAIEVAARVMERRGIVMDEKERRMLTCVYHMTEKYRKEGLV
jgi:UDP-N-acetylglucosamine diphosphorylase/glucosamine-1-phosphate N-acetyltransferase